MYSIGLGSEFSILWTTSLILKRFEKIVKIVKLFSGSEAEKILIIVVKTRSK